MNRLLVLLTVAVSAFPTLCLADGSTFDFGGDRYTGGQNVGITAPVERNAFIAGYDVALTAPVNRDAHLAGFNVNANAPVAGDIYAAGFSVNVAAPVGGDLSAAGNNVSLRAPATIGGNARLAGATVSVAAPIAGSALVSAQTATLDAAIAHDLSFYGENLNFAPGAKVNGMLYIQAPREIAVPASVASADRVQFRQMNNPDYMSEAGRTAQNVVRGFWPEFWAAAVWWLLLLLIGAAFIALAPRMVNNFQVASATRPFRNFGLGILAFALVLGLLPVTAITVVGLLLVPFVLLFIAIICSLAYLAGTYFLGLRIANAYFRIDTNLKRIGVLAVSLALAALIGSIPFLGWLIVLALVAFGLGIFAIVIMARWSARDAARLHSAPPPAASVAASPGA
ncbi:MAG TPA: hypothetical protein VGO70_00865 [Arsenicitalea sp.]|jgi:hypothetical protein|nr:hypothetical protein [Arsenicitalea sp.]